MPYNADSVSVDVQAPPREWRTIRGVLRAVIALTCLYAQFFSPASLVSPVTLVAAVFAAYSLLALLWRKLDELQRSIASLFIEAMYFVVFAVYGADRGGWIGSMLFVYLMIAAVVNHEWGDVFIVVGAAQAFFAFVRAPDEPALRRVVLLAGLLACVLAYHKRKLHQRIGEAARREHALRAEAEKAREVERQRIAGDFHDGPLQHFIALQVRLDILGALLRRDRAAAVEDLKELQHLAKAQVADIRSFLRGMKGVEVDSNDLIASARRIVEYFQKDTGINARFVTTESSVGVPQETGHEILQILREALHNVQKHSQAGRVVVSLEQSGKSIELAVDDDGTGFAFSGTFSLDELDLLRLGPQSIKRRIRALAGDLVIESRPGHGSGIKIKIPVEVRV